ncbi:MAG TPA: HypC/HybG/HupF family hydrogenase formation chaperone [Armatimonadetes bacterium]|nr:HypC/HybG/HupF family hydrogenase formation chaperone [Armatimonadota bacterium]
MCLGIPMRVVEINGSLATVESGGVRREVSIQLVEGVQVGDYVIVHAGFAISVLDEDLAQETLAIIEEMASLASGA